MILVQVHVDIRQGIAGMGTAIEKTREVYDMVFGKKRQERHHVAPAGLSSIS